jgi:hypothetical protein
MTRLIPKVLYKYRGADDLAFELLNGSVFFSPHHLLNDPTDLNPIAGLRLGINREVAHWEMEWDKHIMAGLPDEDSVRKSRESGSVEETSSTEWKNSWYTTRRRISCGKR